MITVQRARELRAMIEKAAGAGLDDKDGSTAVELYPALTGGGALVKSGTRINWKGALKRAAVDLWDTAETRRRPRRACGRTCSIKRREDYPGDHYGGARVLQG